VAQEWAYTSEVLQLDTPPVIGKPGTPAAPAKPAAKSDGNPAADMAL
jgi:malate dehydrogenase (quinone)